MKHIYLSIIYILILSTQNIKCSDEFNAPSYTDSLLEKCALDKSNSLKTKKTDPAILAQFKCYVNNLTKQEFIINLHCRECSTMNADSLEILVRAALRHNLSIAQLTSNGRLPWHTPFTFSNLIKTHQKSPAAANKRSLPPRHTNTPKDKVKPSAYKGWGKKHRKSYRTPR